MSNIKEYGCATLFIAPFILVGVLSFFYPIYQGIRGLTMKKWETVEATILDVRMETKQQRRGTSQEVVPTYQYQYKGITYTGHEVAPGYGSNNTEAHEELYSLLRKSKVVVVHVNPDNPSQAVLATDVSMSLIAIFIFSIMWNSLLGIFIAPRFIKISQEENKHFII